MSHPISATKKILGLSCYYHDSAASIVIGGDIVSAAQEERFTRKKHDSGFPSNAIKFCLEKNGLTFEKFQVTLENLSKSNKAIEFYVNKNIKENTKILNRKKSIIINEFFFNQPEEVVFRSLSKIIHEIGNKKSFTRGRKIVSLINDIKYNKNLRKKTLSGCILEKVNKSIIISKEN